MGIKIKKAIACFLLVVYNYTTAAQPLAPVNDSVILTTRALGSGEFSRENLYIVRNIFISGNKRTHPDIILRELPFGVNESYDITDISNKFQKARKQLMNTGLFREVIVSLKTISANDVYINVEVEEKWYIWPKPFIRTADQSFQEWWKDGDRDMNRINYGLKLTHNNFTGRNDKLKLNIMNGFTRQLAVQYYGLYLDNELKWSVNAGIALGKNREVNYVTQQNKAVPLKDNNRYLRSYLNWFGEITYRPAIKTRHSFGFGYNYENIADTVHKLNPDFSSAAAIRYPEIFYRMSYFDVDFIPYPTRGFISEIVLKRKGFNDPVHLWQLTAKGSKTWPVGKKYFFNASAVGMLKLPFKQPYITNHFIGHDGQFLQGYEYYVIDGMAGGYSKATFTRQLVNTRINFTSGRISRLNNYIPLKIYVKTFVNAGYVHSMDPGTNQFNNRLLYSGGIGIDIIVFTDFVIKLDWSFNRLGENGLYLHKRNYF